MRSLFVGRLRDSCASHTVTCLVVATFIAEWVSCDAMSGSSMGMLLSSFVVRIDTACHSIGRDAICIAVGVAVRERHRVIHTVVRVVPCVGVIADVNLVVEHAVCCDIGRERYIAAGVSIIGSNCIEIHQMKAAGLSWVR